MPSTKQPPIFEPGEKVRHRDAGPDGPIGTIGRRVQASVGAPYMYRVDWPGDRASGTTNGRSLIRVTDEDA